jgi:RNA polymerase sigma factor (sigma-70 family)
VSGASASHTSPTLLGRLRFDPTDQAAWREFVERYGPRIHGWCRRWHLQEADADEVTQDVLVRLTEKLRDFDYDPARSFRGWLKTLTRHAWSDFLEAHRRRGQGSGDSQVFQALLSLEAREDLVQRLEEEFDLELLEQAIARVRLLVAPAKWEVFRLMAHKWWSGAAVAEKLGMKVATVYVVRSKVQKLLEDEIRKLGGASE